MADEPAPAVPEDRQLQVAQETLAELLSRMKITAQVTARWDEPESEGEEGALILDVQGDDLSMLIGPRGETLSALQLITRAIVAKALHGGPNLVVDLSLIHI